MISTAKKDYTIRSLLIRNRSHCCTYSLNLYSSLFVLKRITYWHRRILYINIRKAYLTIAQVLNFYSSLFPPIQINLLTSPYKERKSIRTCQTSRPLRTRSAAELLVVCHRSTTTPPPPHSTYPHSIRKTGANGMGRTQRLSLDLARPHKPLPLTGKLHILL